MTRLLLLVLFVVLAASTAHAQYNVPSQASGDARSRTLIAEDDGHQIAVSPQPPPSRGWELGASIDFMTTSGAGLGERPLEFTDLVLFRVHALVAIGRRGELFGGVDLLPKQPSFTDEHRWQGALVGGRIRFSDAFSAYARGQFGPNLDHDGFWTVGEAAVQYRRDIAERVLFWESSLGGTYTQLAFDGPNDTQFFQTELLTQTGIALRDRKGLFAAWLSFGFHFPLVSRPTIAMPDASGRALDPQVRVGMSAGMLVGVNPGLDLFVEGSVFDRGDLDDPATTLPILSGGFDQRRILFGFNRRFGARKR
jgi:hypothetical protein